MRESPPEFVFGKASVTEPGIGSISSEVLDLTVMKSLTEPVFSCRLRQTFFIV